MKNLFSLVFVILLVVTACASPRGEVRGDASSSLSSSQCGGQEQSPLDHEPPPKASEYGLLLILPFRAADRHAVTQQYRGTTSHRWRKENPNAYYNDGYALDFSGDSGKPILAAEKGTIVIGGGGESFCKLLGKNVSGGGYGKHVFVDHGNGCRTHYAHLSRVDVASGQAVRQGEQIGLLGTTGCSTGPHLHFALHCQNDAGEYEPVRPEPIGGYESLGECPPTPLNTVLGGNSLPTLPVGTLVKDPGRPEIYLVCADSELCHVADWNAFKSRRFFHDAARPDDQVVTLAGEDIACYGRGPDIGGDFAMTLVGCSDGDYLAFREGTSTARRRITFAESDHRRTVLLRSWGFKPQERQMGGTGCSYPKGPDLLLRDGTLIEQAADDSFYVVTASRYDGGAAVSGEHGFVKRIHRFETMRITDYNGQEKHETQPFMSFLYGSYRNVIMAPDDTVLTMTSGMRHDENVFGPTEAFYCPNGPNADGGSTETEAAPVSTTPPATGGPCVHHEHRCPSDDPSSYEVCLMGYDEWGNELATEWSRFPCPSGQACDAGNCAVPPTPVVTDVTQPEEPEAGTAETQLPPHSVYCQRTASGVTATVTGPVLDGTALMTTPTNPTALKLGADGLGWPSAASTPWSGDSASHTVAVPSGVTGFNLYLADSSATGDYWLRLAPNAGAPWTAFGACRAGAYEIEVLPEGEEAPAPETTAESPVAPAPDQPESAAPPPQTAPDQPVQEPNGDEPAGQPAQDGAHVIRCTARADGSTLVTVIGPLLDGLALMATPTAPAALAVGADGLGWPSDISTPWLGDSAAHEVVVPAGAAAFNLYVVDAADPARDSWLRLYAADGSPWTAAGDCGMGSGLILVL